MGLEQLMSICKTEARVNNLDTEDLNSLCNYATEQYNRKTKIITIINNIHYKVKQMLK